MFARGGFDRECIDKVNAANIAFKVQDFRFIHMFKSVASSRVQCPGSSASNMDTSTAQEEADDAQLKLVQSRLKKDVDHWDKHLMRVREHEDSQRYSRRANSRTQDKRVEKAATERQESHYPVRAVKGDQGL